MAVYAFTDKDSYFFAVSEKMLKKYWNRVVCNRLKL